MDKLRIFATAEELEPRRLLAGATIITHGYNSGGGEGTWVDSMGDAIADRIAGGNGLGAAAVAEFTLVVKGSTSGATGYTLTRDPGTPVWGSTANPSGEIIIKLDWAAVQGTFSSQSSTAIADYVTPIFLGNNFDGRSLADVPVQLIGHSRGASLMGQVAKDFGTHGIWVDQFTSLDPHPVDGINEPFGSSINFGDAPMTAWDNIVYADDYWRSDGNNTFDFTGEPITGADNYGPLSLPGGSSLNHSDVHAYYFGTIDRDATVEGASGGPIVASWYTSNDQRATTGFNRSRLDHFVPTGSGVSSLAGGSATRVHVAVTDASPWANVGSLSLNNATISNGGAFSLGYRYQSINAGATVQFYVDGDANPYDGFAKSIGNSGALATTGATPTSASGTFSGTWSTAGLSAGIYNVVAQITDAAAHVRYAYLAQPIRIAPSNAPTTTQVITRQWSGDVSSTWSDPRNWTPGSVPVANDATTIQLSATNHVDIDASAIVVGNVEQFNGTINWLAGAIGNGATTTLTIDPTATMQVSGATSKSLGAGAVINDFGSLNVVSGASISAATSSSVAVHGGQLALAAGSNAPLNLLLDGSSVATLSGVQRLQSLTMHDNARTTLAVGGTSSLKTDSLAMTDSATLDLNDDALIVDYVASSPQPALGSLIHSGRGDGTWTGPGITSSVARNNTLHNTGLALLESAQYRALNNGTTLFAGQTINDSAVLLKYSFNGDTDLNGKVNADDYARIDSGYQNQHNAGFVVDYFTGDFNLDGVINADDYALIDAAYQTQGVAVIAPSKIVSPRLRSIGR